MLTCPLQTHVVAVVEEVDDLAVDLGLQPVQHWDTQTTQLVPVCPCSRTSSGVSLCGAVVMSDRGEDVKQRSHA